MKERLVTALCMFRPDRRHIHHRLLALGYSHRHAVLCLYALALGLSSLALLAVLAQYRNAGVIILAVGLAAYLGLGKLGYDEIVFLRTATLRRWYERLWYKRRFYLACADTLCIALAYWGAFLLKHADLWTTAPVTWYLNLFPFVLVTQQAGLYALGLYRGGWRPAEVGDVMRIGFVVLPAVALSYSMLVLKEPPAGTLSFFGIEALALVMLIVGIRIAYQCLTSVPPYEPAPKGAALIYRADRSGQLILRELLQNPHMGLQPVGFLDDDITLQGRTINRLPVLGPADDLKSVIDNQPVSTLILASGVVHRDRLHTMLRVCQERGITVLQGYVQLVPLHTNGKLHPMCAVQSDTES